MPRTHRMPSSTTRWSRHGGPTRGGFLCGDRRSGLTRSHSASVRGATVGARGSVSAAASDTAVVAGAGRVGSSSSSERPLARRLVTWQRLAADCRAPRHNDHPIQNSRSSTGPTVASTTLLRTSGTVGGGSGGAPRLLRHPGLGPAIKTTV